MRNDSLWRWFILVSESIAHAVGSVYGGNQATDIAGRLFGVCHYFMTREDKIMLVTIAIILIVLWLLGLVTSYTMGGFIHILLVIAVVVILIRIIQGRRL
jgi:hypothetical protein